MAAVLIMLDLDNTLNDRQGAVEAWAAEFSAEHGLGPEAVAWIIDADNDGYSDRRQVFAAISERFALADTVDELVSRYQRRVVELARPMTGAVACLVALRERGHRLALVTNGSSGQQQAKIDVLELRDLVDGICVSAELGIKKPDAGLFEAAVDATGASMEGAWMVGDSPLHDIDGARRLGVRTAWIRRGRSWNETDYAPTVMIDALDELIPAMDRANPTERVR